MLRAPELERVWYGGQPPGIGLLLLASLYGVLAALRRALYRAGLLRRVRLPLPVLVVGNLGVGGTGKTPLTIALVEALRARGWRPGVVSRGYGGRVARPQRVAAGADPAAVGDEPCLIAARTGAPMAVGRDRIAAAHLLQEEGAVDVLIADDGLQHYRLCRDVEICVIDGQRRFGNARLLPAGPLREPPARLATVDFRVCNGGDPAPGEVPMRLVPGAVRRLDGTETRALAAFAGQRVHAVAGIGHPARFFALLRAHGIEVQEHAFPDHHAFRPDDLAFGDTAPVLMTEKDAVKCRAFVTPSLWSVAVDAQLPAAFFDAVAARLRAVRP